MENNFNQGLAAFENKDFKTAFEIWYDFVSASSLNADQANKIHQVCTTVIGTHPTNEWNYIMLCFLYLDYSDNFIEDREEALLQVVSWGKKAIEINENNHYSQRFTGSALYWLDDYEAALKYYKKSNALLPQIDLQVRIFDIESTIDNDLDVTLLQFDFSGEDAGEFYRAGVSLTELIESYDEEQEKNHLKTLKLKCYERSYQLFYDYLTHQKGNPINNQGHTFAMCCNNLSMMYNEQKRHNEAVTVLTEGLKYSEFQHIWHNLMYSYSCLDEKTKREEVALQLLKDYQLDTLLFFECLFYAVAHYLKKDDSQTAIEYADIALNEYLELSPEEQANENVLHYYSGIYSNKVIAQSNLGILDPTTIDPTAADTALNETPDDPYKIIDRGGLFRDANEFDKALDCFNQAIHFAIQQNDEIAMVAGYRKRGHLNLLCRNDVINALQDYENIERMGKSNFDDYYNQASCHYTLKQPEAALEKVDKAIALMRPEDKDRNAILASLYMMQGDSLYDIENYKEAIPAYELSLHYEFNQGVQDNYELAKVELNNQEMYKKDNGGFFGKLFGK
jgi:tetratricopeptide (TPR) repeat protein